MATSKNKKIAIIVTALLLVPIAVFAYMQYIKAVKPTNTPATTVPQQTTDPDTIPTAPSTTEPDTTTESTPRNYELITEDERFAIRHQSGTTRYLITLYPIINRPEQHDQYHEQLREYKQAALDYLKAQGVDPATLDITYEPAEAKDL